MTARTPAPPEPMPPAPEAYPVGLRLAGRRVLVVGGGQVAQRRLPSLLDAHADVVLVSPEVTPAVEGMVTAPPGGPARGSLQIGRAHV